MTPEQRALRARLAAHSRWSQQDRVVGTAAARRAFNERFERLVDPNRELTDRERWCRADSARKAYFDRLALASSRARQHRSED